MFNKLIKLPSYKIFFIHIYLPTIKITFSNNYEL